MDNSSQSPVNTPGSVIGPSDPQPQQTQEDISNNKVTDKVKKGISVRTLLLMNTLCLYIPITIVALLAIGSAISQAFSETAQWFMFIIMLFSIPTGLAVLAYTFFKIPIILIREKLTTKERFIAWCMFFVSIILLVGVALWIRNLITFTSDSYATQ